MSYDLLLQKTLFFYPNIQKRDILVLGCKLHKYLVVFFKSIFINV